MRKSDFSYLKSANKGSGMDGKMEYILVSYQL